MMKDVQRILKTGSKLFRKYLALQDSQKKKESLSNTPWNSSEHTYLHEAKNGIQRDSLLEVIECNSVLSNLTAMQKRYLESLAEGPRYFGAHSLMWKVGDNVDYAYLIVGGTAKLGRIQVTRASHSKMNRRGSTGTISGAAGLGSIAEHTRGSGGDRGHFSPQPIQPIECDKQLQGVHPNSEYARLEAMLQIRAEDMEAEEDDAQHGEHRHLSSSSHMKPGSNLGRFANKVLARLYSRKAYTEHMTFSRGNFLSDTSRMVSGDLANINKGPGMTGSMRSSIGSTANDHHCHTSNLMAGAGGCVVMIFPKSTLVPFLDGNPGVLLCLLGSQVVV